MWNEATPDLFFIISHRAQYNKKKHFGKHNGPGPTHFRVSSVMRRPGAAARAIACKAG